MSVLRERFEQWYRSLNPLEDKGLIDYCLGKDVDSVYFNGPTEHLWIGFQGGNAINLDLLEALERLVAFQSEREPFTDAGMWEWKTKRHDVIQAARAAIKKARGEQ